ncbi:energy transducer TonB [bacterium]|nr:energy transducer TonB [bacterium]
MKIITLVLPLVLSVQAAGQEQEAAGDFTPRVEHPAFKPGTGPEIWIDEAHHNFHTRGGRYRAFGDLLEADGFQVAASVQPFTSGSLDGCDILVISNALSEQDGEDWALPSASAFTPEEIAVVRDWVDQGGGLWLIVDHMPMPGCNNELAAAFGVSFSNGYAMVPGHQGALVFRREDGGLADHPITWGARADEKIGTVASFTGSAFRADPSFEPLMILPPDTESWLTASAGDFTDDTPREDVGGWLQGGVQEVGRGRIAVFGEAAMFTAQVARDGDAEVRFGFIAPAAPDNQQFLLNVARWLAPGSTLDSFSSVPVNRDWTFSRFTRPRYPAGASAADRSRPVRVRVAVFVKSDGTAGQTILLGNSGAAAFGEAVLEAAADWTVEWQGDPGEGRWIMTDHVFRDDEEGGGER